MEKSKNNNNNNILIPSLKNEFNKKYNHNTITNSINNSQTIDINSTDNYYIKNNINSFIEPPTSKSNELIKKERLENMQQILYEIKDSHNNKEDIEENFNINHDINNKKNIINLNSEEKQKQENRFKEFDKIINEEKEEQLKRQKELEELKLKEELRLKEEEMKKKEEEEKRRIEEEKRKIEEEKEKKKN